MAAQTSLDQVQELYIAYYGRPADEAGLQYWAGALDSANGDISNVINAFATSAESVALYGSDASPTALVTAIYENVLHRAPDAAGTTFYENALTSGQITAGNLALAVLDGVQNGDVAMAQNELSAANQFTAAAVTYGGDAASAIARTFLSQVSGDNSAEASLLTHLTAYANAVAAATTDPSQFAGDISGGVLTNPEIVDSYSNGTSPTPPTGSSGSSSADSGLTVAQAIAISPGSQYTLADSLANLESAPASIVSGATSYVLSDAANTNFGALSVANATIVSAASNLISGGYSYSISDTSTDILTHSAMTAESDASSIAMNVDSTTTSGTLQVNSHHLVNITGSSDLSLVLQDGGFTVNASSFNGALTLTDSGDSDTITTGSGTTTIIESWYGPNQITFSAHGTNVDTLIVSALPTTGTVIDVVNGFMPGHDVIELQGVSAMAAGSELAASNGLVTSPYTTLTQFVIAAEQVTGAKAGDAVAWANDGNTYLAVFQGAQESAVHIIELVGLSAKFGLTPATESSGIHIA